MKMRIQEMKHEDASAPNAHGHMPTLLPAPRAQAFNASIVAFHFSFSILNFEF